MNRDSRPARKLLVTTLDHWPIVLMERRSAERHTGKSLALIIGGQMLGLERPKRSRRGRSGMQRRYRHSILPIGPNDSGQKWCRTLPSRLRKPPCRCECKIGLELSCRYQFEEKFGRRLADTRNEYQSHKRTPDGDIYSNLAQYGLRITAYVRQKSRMWPWHWRDEERCEE